MPIDIEEFESAVEREEEPTTAALIVEFLSVNRDSAFRRTEIAAEIDRNANTVGTALSRLKDRGLVRHRKQHWALTDDQERLQNAVETSRSLRHLRDEFGPVIEGKEDARAWSDAQPDEPHPSDTDDETSSGPSESTPTQ